MIRAALRSPLLRKPLHQIEAYRARKARSSGAELSP
jgi:hypothetical protein